MKYKVVKYFTDLKDGNHPYQVGDFYPREGLEVSEERIKELLSPNNLQNTPLIEMVEIKKEVKEEVMETEEIKEEKPKSKKKK